MTVISIEERIARMKERVAERRRPEDRPEEVDLATQRAQCWGQIRKYLPELADEMLEHKDFFSNLQALEVDTPEGHFEYRR